MTSHTLADIAEYLIVSLRTVEAYIASGELRAVNVSRNRQSRKPRLRVMQVDLDAFLAGRATDAGVTDRPPRRRRRVETAEQFV